MAYAEELEALGTLADNAKKSKLASMVAWYRMKVYRAKVEAYESCFVGEDGELTPHARFVLADLAQIAGLGHAPAGMNDAQLREQQGARRVVLHLLEFLREDPRKLRKMAQKVRELRTNE